MNSGKNSNREKTPDTTWREFEIQPYSDESLLSYFLRQAWFFGLTLEQFIKSGLTIKLFVGVQIDLSSNCLKLSLLV